MAEEIWTIKAALDWTAGYLERKGDESPLVSAQWLLSEATGLSRVELYVNYDRPLSMDERDLLRGYVTRRGKGEPLQYITGEVGFRHLTVRVRPGVLIPRPETEVLVSEVLAALPTAERPRSAEFLAEMAEMAELAEMANLTETGGGADGASTLGDADGAPTFGNANGASTLGCAASRGESDRADSAFENVSRETFVPLASESEAAFSEIADYDPFDPFGPSDPSDPFDPFDPSDPFAAASNAPRAAEKRLLLADICTGSGCIACSLAYEHPDAYVVATDIAPAALELARENVAQLDLDRRVEVLESDLGEGIPADLLGSFDAVVSNPPYVPTAVLGEIPSEVADYEPALALDGGEDGLDLYRRLLVWAMDALKPRGFFACELHETCLDTAADLARSAGYENVRVVYDLAGKPRILTAVRP